MVRIEHDTRGLLLSLVPLIMQIFLNKTACNNFFTYVVITLYLFTLSSNLEDDGKKSRLVHLFVADQEKAIFMNKAKFKYDRGFHF